MSGAEKILLARMTLIRHRSSGGRPEDDDAIVRQFDIAGMAEFWDVVLSEPMEAESFVLALAAHFMVIEHKPGATADDLLASGRAAKQVEGAVRAQLRTALRQARIDEEPWFIELPLRGQPSDPGPKYREVLIYSAKIGPPKKDLALVVPADPPPDGVDLSRLKVRPRPAVEWLLAMPRRQHLVPPSLVAAIKPEASVPSLPGPVTSTPESSGGPGRPTSMHLVEAEMTRRATVGELEKTMRAEGVALSAWLTSAHPMMPRVQAKAIQNALGAKYKKIPK